jgi:hypothetical protein
MKPYDLIRKIDKEKIYHTGFTLSPPNWKGYQGPPVATVWNTIPFKRAAAQQITATDHGVYSFVIDPRVLSHPKNSFVAYVGKADRLTIKKRFESYFREKATIKRPAITVLLNRYSKYLEFCFLPITNGTLIPAVEDALIIALDPPFNRQYPAQVSKIRRGLT